MTTGVDDLATAAMACKLWGCTAAPRLVARRENAVFRITLPTGPGALRLHRPGNTDLAGIEAELFWMESLADAGIACPRPVRSANGRYCETIAGKHVSVVAWIDARHRANGANSADLRQYHRLGRCLAAFHLAADRLALCPVPRRTWKADDLVGPAPRWGGFWRNPSLTPSERGHLAEMRDAARASLLSIDQPDVGLIHADALEENVLDDGERLWLIDFDDAGWGYRGYDLGTALIQRVHLPGHSERIAALADGYRDGRPGSCRQALDIPLFVLIRGLVTAGWVVPRVPAGDRRLRSYAERAIAAAQAFAAE